MNKDNNDKIYWIYCDLSVARIGNENILFISDRYFHNFSPNLEVSYNLYFCWQRHTSRPDQRHRTNLHSLTLFFFIFANGDDDQQLLNNVMLLKVPSFEKHRIVWFIGPKFKLIHQICTIRKRVWRSVLFLTLESKENSSSPYNSPHPAIAF